MNDLNITEKNFGRTLARFFRLFYFAMKRVAAEKLVVLHLFEFLGRLGFVLRRAVARRRNALFTGFSAFQSD